MAMGGLAQLQDGGKLESVLGKIPVLKKFVKGKKLFDKAKDAKKYRRQIQKQMEKNQISNI